MIVKQEGEEEREAHKDQPRWERKHCSALVQFWGGIYEFIPVNHIWDIGTLCYNKGIGDAGSTADIRMLHGLL